MFMGHKLSLHVDDRNKPREKYLFCRISALVWTWLRLRPVTISFYWFTISSIISINQSLTIVAIVTNS